MEATKEFYLKPYKEEEDFEFVMSIYRNERLKKYLYTDQFKPDMAEKVMKEQLNQSVNWLCMVNNKPGGYIGLQFESDFVTLLHGSGLPEYFGRGYAQKALSYVLDFAFKNQKLKKVEGMVPGNNLLMSRFLERARFKKEGELRNRVSVNGKFYPAIFYGMTDGDYFNFNKEG